MEQAARRTILESVERAMRRSSSVVVARMRRGTNSLATIAAVAPLLAMLPVLIGIVGSFHGCGCEKMSYLWALNDSLANALARCLPGLFVGILAQSIYHHLATQVRSLELDMQTASLHLLNLLSRR